MSQDAILNVLCGQLAVDDPDQFADVLDLTSDRPIPPLVELIRRLVAQAFERPDDAPRPHEDQRDAEFEVWHAVARAAELLGRASAALMLQTCSKRAGGAAPHPAPVATPEDMAENFELYLVTLQFFATALMRHPIDPLQIPVSEQTPEELAALPPVFSFLAQRRLQLRTLVHPNTNQYTLSEPLSSLGADRGDELLSLYATVVLPTEPEEPENWTLRDKPDVLRQAMKDVLCDLHHLADAAEISWKTALAEGEGSYQGELEDGG